MILLPVVEVGCQETEEVVGKVDEGGDDEELPEGRVFYFCQVAELLLVEGRHQHQEEGDEDYEDNAGDSILPEEDCFRCGYVEPLDIFRFGGIAEVELFVINGEEFGIGAVVVNEVVAIVLELEGNDGSASEADRVVVLGRVVVGLQKLEVLFIEGGYLF